MDPGQVVTVRLPAGPGTFRWGSGYLIAPGVVLTAAHVATADGAPAARQGTAVQVREWGATSWRDGTVAWASGCDVAVLTVPGCGPAARPPRWATLAGTGALSWTAVGFPHASLREHQRQPEQCFGQASALTDSFAGRLGLQVTSRHARRPAGTGQAAGAAPSAASGWVGMSGAAVFSGTDPGNLDCLVGVITSDEQSYAGSLGAVRAGEFAAEPGLAGLLGAAPVLETVRADPLGAGLRAVAVDLPPGAAAFAGRAAELAALDAGGPVQVLTGLGGTGKSALAAHWARANAGRAELAWWFTAADRAALTAAMAARYRQVAARADDIEAEDGARALVTWLSNCPYRWVLVLDNAAGPAALDGLVPRSPRGQVVITSRFAQWSGLTTEAHQLGALPAPEAAALLSAAAGQPDGPDCAELADELGGLPLALTQAGAYLRGKGTGYARYRQLLAASAPRLLAADQTATGQTVAAVLDTSLAQVTAAHGALAATVLGVLAWLAPDVIPRELLAAPAIDGQPLLDGGDELSVDDALGGLTAYSLVQLSEQGIVLHPLIAELSRTDPASLGLALALLARLLDGARQQPPASRTTLTDRLLPHLLAATRHAAGPRVEPGLCCSLLATVAADRIGIGQLGAAGSLLAQARAAGAGLGPADLLPVALGEGRLLKLSGRAGAAVELLTAAENEARQLVAPDNPVALDLRYELADSLRRVSEPGYAGRMLADLARDQEKLLGPASRATLVTRHALAHLRADYGQAASARALEEVLAAEEQALGPTTPRPC